MRDPVMLDIETTGRMPWEGRLICAGVGSRAVPGDDGRFVARMLLARPNTVVCHTNYDLRWVLLDGASMHAGVGFHDTKVMAWLVDPTTPLDLESLADRYLGFEPPKYIKMRGKILMWDHPAQPIMPLEDAPLEQVLEYNESDLSTTQRLYEYLKARLEFEGLWQHFLEEEAPFSRLLVEMEAAGMPINRDATELELGVTRQRMDEIRTDLRRRVGTETFNPGAANQVADYLYGRELQIKARWKVGEEPPVGAEERSRGRIWVQGVATVPGRALKPPPMERGKDGKMPTRPTVNAKALRVFYVEDEWVQIYLAYKRQEKIAGSFLEPLLEWEHNGRVHGRFDQSGTDTGRISGKDPNLTAIDKSPAIRSLFRGDLVIGDYSGLEMRLSAHFSQDPGLMDIFLNGKDVYGTMASHAWGGPETKQHPKRPLMKTLVLGSQYGAQAKKLAAELNEKGFRHTVQEAGQLLKTLEHIMPRMFEWREEVIEQVRHNGHSTTIGGRHRPLPNIRSRDWKLKSDAERQAVSSTVQGSAADIVRRAMLVARRAVSVPEARMLLQVHDEILWQRGPEWSEDAFARLRRACEFEHGFTLSVPLIFEAKEAQSWAEKE